MIAYKLALVAITASALFGLGTFENAADIHFFAGFPAFFSLWRLTQSGEREVAVLPCSEMGQVHVSQTPILFKQCMPESIRTARELLYFEDKQQNLFASCGREKKLRHFEFHAADGSTKAIVEDVPCGNSTLDEKILRFDSHDIGTEGDYFEVHTYMMDAGERAHVFRNLTGRGVLPPALQPERMVTPTLSYFLHAGRPAVYYLHAHMDHFLSFCVQEEKEWVLIDPVYFSNFESKWSGNAQMMLRERVRTPRLTLKQRRGDVLFIPPWWVHETKVREGKKNLGVNVHWLAQSQFLGTMSWILGDVLGDKSWFYAKI